MLLHSHGTHTLQSSMGFLENNKILSDYQHGFRMKRPCGAQVITTLHNLTAGLDRRQQVDTMLLDFSKAFNNIPHQRLAVNTILASDERQEPILDPKFPHRQEPASYHRWEDIISCCCHVEFHKVPVPRIHQWPVLKSFIFSTTFRWWLSTV